MALPSHYDTGTVTVANGGTAVTGVGTGWNGVVFAGDLLHDPAQGIVARIAADATSDTALTLATGWPGTALSGDAYEILFTADSVRASERTRQLLEQLSTVQANGRGLFYLFDDGTTDADPGAGLLRLNHATIASATAAYIDDLDANGATVAGDIDTWDDSTSAVKGKLWVRSVSAPEVFYAFSVTGSVVDGTGYRKLTLAYVAGSGSLTAGDAVMVFFAPTGDVGIAGSTGSTNHALLRAFGTGGAAVTGSPVTVDDNGNMSGVRNITTTSDSNTIFELRATDSPIMIFQAIASAANNKIFHVVSHIGDFFLRSRNDDGSAKAEMWRCSHNGGMTIGIPTGGNKGNGTLNAVAVYDDNTLLTCMALQSEFLANGEIDLAKWDAYAPDQIIAESREQVPVMARWTVTEKVAENEPDETGRLIRRMVEKDVVREAQEIFAEPVYDERGKIVGAVETPLFTEVVVPEQVIVREHRTARVFKTMIESGFDPRDPEQYFAKMRADEALPGMPTKADWQHNSLSIGEQFGRKWLAMEMLAIVANVMWVKIKDHEARIAALEQV